MFLRTSNTTNGKNDLTLSASGPRNQRNFLFLSLFCSCRNQAELYLSHLGNRIQKMQLVTDLVSNELEWDAWWTSMPTTGLSLERREDKEKQIEECQTLKKTDPRSAASSWVGADAVPVLLSPRPPQSPSHVWLWRASYGWAKRIPHFHLCTFSPGCIHVFTLVSQVCVLCFYFSLSDRTQ